jgi:carboxyl-terminal processing protease
MVQMGKWIKGLILGTFTIGVLLGSGVDRSDEAPSADSYWFQTGLSDKELFQFLQDSYCHSTDRYFLACLNSIQQVAIRNGLILLPNKGFQKVSAERTVEFSEKDLLDPWQLVRSTRKGTEVVVPFQKLWNELETKYIDKPKRPMMVGVALNGFLSVFRDPHTYIIPIDYYKQIIASSDYKTSSYGFVITKVKQKFFVKKVIPGSPSDYVGLRRGQEVTKINNWDLEDMALNTLNEKIRSDRSYDIQISVRDYTGGSYHFSVKKSNQALSTVHLKFIEAKTPIALLTLDRFSRKSCEKVKAALTEVREMGVRNLILDLRDNPGGQMDEAGCIASLFTGPDKKIFSVQYLQKAGRNESYISEEEQAYLGRTVVLINRGTASASEILAGALREYNQSPLIGERTFGKGSFQEGDVWNLNSKLALFETKGFYYLPSGFSPQKMGLSPDLSVESANSGSREEGQYWNSLDLSQKETEPKTIGLPFETCQSMDQLTGTPEDPEITKAQQALSCWGVAQVSGGWR